MPETKKELEKNKKDKENKVEKSKIVKKDNIKRNSKKAEKSNKAVTKKKTEKIKKNIEKIEKITNKKIEKQSKNAVKKSKNIKPINSKKSPSKKVNFLQEYYDLPYRYNETVVKILAQTPKRLFVYWEVSEKDKETYINAFGEDFFEKTYPVLLVHNENLNYTFEIPINDFANSWYLDIQDSKSKYVVQLGRKFRNVQDIKVSKEVIQEKNINLNNDYIEITNSNELETPNDHVLLEKLEEQIIYRNVKTGNEVKKDISVIIESLKENYKDANIEDIYKELYGEEISEELLHNPSSAGTMLSSSGGAISRV